jgi:hypothetical protein
MALRVLITVLALVAAVAHRYWPWFGTRDHFEITLLIVAILPWAGAIFKSIEIPGIGKFELQELKRQVAENRGTILSVKQEVRGAVQSLEQRTDALFQPLRSPLVVRGETPRSLAAELKSLGQQYVDIRKRLASGKEKTAQMSVIFGQMVALSASVDDIEVERYLLSDDAGERLQAYAFLYAKPRASALEQLVKTVTSGLEPYPFSQYWGIRSIGRILETVDSKTVSASVKRELSTFCNQVSTDTDRHFELSKIAETLGFEC